MRSATPGRWFCTKRSARATIRLSSSRPRGSRRFSATERLLRLITAKAGATPRLLPPIARVKSPIPGGSILITSAPWSPRIIVAIGPERFCVTSTIRIPLSGPSDEAGMIMLPRDAILAERRDDFFCDCLHVARDIVVAACPTEHHASRSCVDIFPQRLAAIVRAAVEHVAAGNFREILRVVPAERSRRDLLGFFTVRIHRGEDKQSGPEGAHVAPGLAPEGIDFSDTLAQHLGRVHVGQPSVGISCRAAHRRLLAPGNPDRRMGFLNGRR